MTVGLVHGERGGTVDALCNEHGAWTLAHRAAISARSSAMTLGGISNLTKNLNF